MNSRQQPRPSRHIGHRDGNPTSTTPFKSSTSESIRHRDARKSFRIRSYAKCGVSPASLSPFLKDCLNFLRLIATLPQSPHKTRPLFSWACALFHFPYGVTPLFVTLTKTAGCMGFLPNLELSQRQMATVGARYIVPSLVVVNLLTSLKSSHRL